MKSFDMVDISLWKVMQSSFASVAGSPLVVVDENGDELVAAGEQPFYVQLIKKHKPSFYRDTFRANLSDDLKLFLAEDGLYAMSMPIVDDGTVAWALFTGLRRDEPDFHAIALKVGIEEEELKESFRDIQANDNLEGLKLLIKAFAETVFTAASQKQRSVAAQEQAVLERKILEAGNHPDIQRVCAAINELLISTMELAGSSIILNGSRYGSSQVKGEPFLSVEQHLIQMVVKSGSPSCFADLSKDFTFSHIKDIDKAGFAVLSVPINKAAVTLYRKKPFGNPEIEQVRALLPAMQSAMLHAEIFGRTHESSIRDKLTGLYNRRYSDEFFAKVIEIARRESGPTSLLLFDVDDFKQYNDANGHVEGDELLAEIGVIIQQSIRSSDVAARYGGEEFVVLLPNTKQEDAGVVAQRLKDAVSSHDFRHRQGQPLGCVSISIGQIVCMNSSITLSDMYRHADSMLYKAKEAGKNCVRSMVVLDKAIAPVEVDLAS